MARCKPWRIGARALAYLAVLALVFLAPATCEPDALWQDVADFALAELEALGVGGRRLQEAVIAPGGAVSERWAAPCCDACIRLGDFELVRLSGGALRRATVTDRMEWRLYGVHLTISSL
jgi:hypothetical protein